MPMAGFWSIGGYQISFRKDGRWYADDEVIGNSRIARLFAENVQPDGKGGWVIDVGIDRHPVTVEDTALVVNLLEGDPASGFRVHANDGITDELRAETLAIGPDNVLYCELDRGERGKIRARFLRGPYYLLTSHIDLDEATGTAYLRERGRRHAIPRVAGAS